MCGKYTKNKDKQPFVDTSKYRFLIVGIDIMHSWDLINLIRKYFGQATIDGFATSKKYVPIKPTGLTNIFYFKINDLKKALQKVCDQYDFIIPVGFKFAKISSEVLSASKCKKLISPPPKVLNKFSNKMSAYKIISKYSNSLLFPRTQVISCIRDLKGISVSKKNPVFLKSLEEGSGIREVIVSREILENRVITLLNKGYTPIVQEYVNSPYTYGLGFYAVNGQLMSSTLHKELISMPISGGSGAILSKPEMSIENFRNALSYLVKEYNYTGFGLIEFKYVYGKYYFMEINPKTWASISADFYFFPEFERSFIKSLGLEWEDIIEVHPLRNLRKSYYIYAHRLLRAYIENRKKVKKEIKRINLNNVYIHEKGIGKCSLFLNTYRTIGSIFIKGEVAL